MLLGFAWLSFNLAAGFWNSTHSWAVTTLAYHEPIAALTFTENGRQLISTSCSTDGRTQSQGSPVLYRRPRFQKWNLATGEVETFAFDPDFIPNPADPLDPGIQFATIGRGREVDGATILTSPSGRFCAVSVRRSVRPGEPDGRLAQSCFVFDFQTGKTIFARDVGMQRMGFSQNEEWCFLIAGHETVANDFRGLIQLPTGIPHSIPVFERSVDYRDDVWFSTESRKICVRISRDGEAVVSVCSLPDGKIAFERKADIRLAAFSSDGRLLAIRGENFLQVLNAETGAIERELETGFYQNQMMFLDGDTKVLLCGGNLCREESNQVELGARDLMQRRSYLYDIAGSSTMRLDGNSTNPQFVLSVSKRWDTCMGYSRDSGIGGGWYYWDLGRQKCSPRFDAQQQHVAMSPTGTHAVVRVGGSDFRISVRNWLVRKGVPVSRLPQFLLNKPESRIEIIEVMSAKSIGSFGESRPFFDLIRCNFSQDGNKIAFKDSRDLLRIMVLDIPAMKRRRLWAWYVLIAVNALLIFAVAARSALRKENRSGSALSPTKRLDQITIF